MSLLLSNLNNQRELFDETLQCCSHIIELDFMRKDFEHSTSEWREFEKDKEKIHVLSYTILENNTINHSLKFAFLPNLLFVDYPNYVDSHIKNTNDMSDEFHQNVKSIYNIPLLPLILKQESVIDIDNNLQVNEVMEFIEKNLTNIQENYSNNLNKFAIYIQLYIDILNEFAKCRFTNREHKRVQSNLKHTNFLKVAVELDVQSKEVQIDKNKYEEMTRKNNYFVSLMNKVDYLEVTFKNNEVTDENVNWINQLKIDESKSVIFVVENKGTYIIVRYDDDSSLLLSLYSELSQFKQIDVNLVMSKDEVIEHNDEIVPHTIEISSTPWAYVFNKLYGNDTKYTKEKDEKVQEVLVHVNKTGISAEYILSL